MSKPSLHEPAPPPPTPVLLIEDHELFARGVAGFLAKAEGRFALTHVVTLADGLAALAAQPAGVILLDLTLPDSCGIETFRRVHACAGNTPIVVLTGHDDEESALETVRQGAQDYISKADLNDRLLVRALRYAIERARLLQALREAMANLKTLRGLLPICACCKRIRNDTGYWQEVEGYVRAHTQAEFSHSYCHACLEKLLAEADADTTAASSLSAQNS